MSIFERSGDTIIQLYGYVRVSSREQNADRQLIAMRKFGISDKNIMMDKTSEKTSVDF